MTSSRQVAANRANARKSTGPKTPAGKAVAKGNATRHAVLQGQLYATRDEDAGALDAMRDAFAAEFAPSGPLEAALVERMVSSLWRLRRVQAAEVGMNDGAAMFADLAVNGADYAGEAFVMHRDTFAVLSRYEGALERSLYGALHELQRLQAARRSGADVPAPAVVDVEVRGLPEGAG
jgi:hypothetical protein